MSCKKENANVFLNSPYAYPKRATETTENKMTKNILYKMLCTFSKY